MLRLLAHTAGLLLAAGPALADPGYYLVSVYDNEGQGSIDFRYWTVQQRGRPMVTWPEIGIGYNVTGRWYTELYASYIHSRAGGTGPSTLNWQNDFLLTQGQWPIDVALHTVWIRPRDGAGGHAFEFGPALQTDFGRTQLNLNLFAERGTAADAPRATQAKIQWQAKYRFRGGLHLGLQGFSEPGPWGRWDPWHRQSHRAGPMLQARWPLAQGQALQLDAAYLYGRVYGAPARMFSLRTQLLF